MQMSTKIKRSSRMSDNTFTAMTAMAKESMKKLLVHFLTFVCQIVTVNSKDVHNNVTMPGDLLELNCDNVLSFTNGVLFALKDVAIVSEDVSPSVERQYVYLYDLPCQLMSYAHSLLHVTKHLNYVSFSNWACLGAHSKSKRRQKLYKFSFVAHFLLQIIRNRRWSSLVVFVDHEDDYQSATLMNALTDNGIPALMLKVKESSGKTWEGGIIPPVVIQYHNLVILSKHSGNILAEAQKMNLFADPYRWMVITDAHDKVLGRLKNLSLQYVNEVTIAVPDRVTAAQPSFVKDLGLDSPLVFTCKTSVKSYFKETKHHLQKITTNHYQLHHYSMLCQGRKFDLQSKGFWDANLFPRKDPIQMKWPPRSRNSNFTGCVFRVAVAHNPPYIIVDKKNKRNFSLSGFDYDVFIELSKLMHFGYKFYLVDDGEYGRVKANGTMQRWTGLIGELASGRAHMALPSLTLTEDRFKVVDFSTQVSTSKTRIFIRQLRPGVVMGRYYAPFQLSLWCMIIGHLAVFTVAYTTAHFWRTWCCRSTLDNSSHKPSRSNLNGKDDSNQWRCYFTNLLNTFYNFLCSSLLQGSEHSPIGLSERLLFATFVVLVVLLHAIYSSVLVSYMSVIRPNTHIKSIEELAYHRDYIPCILLGSSHEEIIKGRHKRVYQRIAAYGGQGFMPTYEAAISSMFNKKCAFISNVVNVEHMLQGNCSFQIVGREVYRFTQHLAFQQGFPHQAAFSIYLMKLQSAGLQSRLFSKHFHPMFGHCYGRSDHQSLTFDHVKSPFFVLCGGFITAILILILEWLFYRCRFKFSTTSVPKKKRFVGAFTVD